MIVTFNPSSLLIVSRCRLSLRKTIQAKGILI
jgi:hypothetical protein